MAASRSPSPMASPGPELLLSPRSRMEARLAAMDSSSEDEDSHSAPRQARKASGEQTPTRRSPAAIPTQDSEDDSEDDIRPRGRLAARMHDMATKATSQDASMADADEEEDDEDIIAAPRRLKRRDADGATTPREQSPAASSSPGLFVSRHQTPAPAEQANASDSDNSLPDMKSSRFAALVKRKREERLAREAEEERKREERMARQVGLDTLDDSDGNVSSITDDEGGRQLSQKVRPTRKAGKKAIEEMNRETQRMARNMQLAHEAKTRKKITKASLFERFNFRTAPAAEPTPELKTTNSSRPTSPVSAHNSDVDMKDAETPPSSPPANAGSPTKPSTTAQPAAAAAQDDEDDLPTLEELLRGAPEKSDKAKGKEIAVDSPPKPTTKDAVPKRQFRVKMPAVSANLVSLDSDDELEIAVAKRTTRIDAVFDRVPEKKTNEAQALHALRLLAQVTSPGKESRKKSDGKLSMTSGELQLMLHQRARQQAKLERERRLEALKAKGIVVQTVEEREKEMQDVEDVVTKARKEAEEIMEREREAAKEERRTKIKNGELDPLAWDDSEDDDDYEGSDEGQGDEKDVELELSGSEDEDAMADSDAEDGNPLVDNEADEDEDETVAATNQDVADSDEEASLPTRNVRRSKKNAHVISDDEDEDEVVEATPKPKMTSLVSPVVPTTKSPAVPTSVLRSAKKSFIPGLPITGPAGLGLTQIFAGTMDDSQDMPESATMASPMPSFGGFPNFDEETQPGDEMILDSQAADTQKAPTQQDVETQGIQLHYTQSQMHGFNSLLRDDNLNSTQVDFEPSQDGGLQEYTPLRERFFDAPSTAQTHPLDRDVDGESVQDSPLVRRGRLRRKIESIAEEPESTFASKVGLLNGAEAGASATAFETMKAAAKKEKKIKEYNKKKSKAKDMFEEQADESEDEYAGLGGADGEDSSDDDDAASVKEMIDDEAGKDGDERKNAALYAERERARDEQQVDKLFHDLTTGMLRRKRGADYDLSDSDDGGEARRRLKRRQFAKMQKALFTDERIKKIAENPGNQAFMRTIEDRGSDEEMDFLEMGPEPAEEASQSQEQTVPDSQPAAGTTEPLGAAGASRVSANPRRTKEGRKPSNIGEIRESLSSLLEDPNDLLVTATEIGSDSEGDDERPSTSRSNKENTSPGKANPRRTAAPKHAIIDRMSLKRDSSSNLSTSSKLAFTSATSSSGFKVPALLRRATTNSLTSASTGGTSSGRSAGASSGFGDDGKIRKSAGKKSGVSYLARETERRSVIQQHDKRREARKLRGAEKRGKAVGGLFGSGQFE
ncbi:hypothetical protein ACHAQA_001846 [Verticillium albo-atrum]